MSIRKRIEELDEKLQPENRHKFAPEELASMSEQLHNLAHIQMLWDQFEDIPMNPHLEITEQPWHSFPAGTHRETIWHWFENEFHISVAEDLMYETDDETTASTDSFRPYLVDYIRSELCRNNLDGSDKEIDAVIFDITKNSIADPVAKFVSIISEKIQQCKNARPEYIVEIFDPNMKESPTLVGTYTKQDDAVELMNNIIGLSIKTQNKEYIGVKIKEIKHGTDENEVDAKIVNIKSIRKGHMCK